MRRRFLVLAVALTLAAGVCTEDNAASTTSLVTASAPTFENSSWSGITDLPPTCGDPGTTWTTCDRSIVIDNSWENDATVFRVYMRSTSNAHVYVDQVGAYGGTTP